ncbi:hypothetical protein D3C84_1023950 [compost metagenome]
MLLEPRRSLSSSILLLLERVLTAYRWLRMPRPPVSRMCCSDSRCFSGKSKCRKRCSSVPIRFISVFRTARTNGRSSDFVMRRARRSNPLFQGRHSLNMRSGSPSVSGLCLRLSWLLKFPVTPAVIKWSQIQGGTCRLLVS